MTKNNLTGWRDVFSFTLKQTLKSKAYIISFMILLLISIASMPILSLITASSQEDADAISPIEKVYVVNKTSLPEMDFSEIMKDPAFQNITFETLTQDYNKVSDRIKTSENTSVILTFAEENGTFGLDFVKAGTGPVTDSSLQKLGSAIDEQFGLFRIKTLGITNDQVSMLNATVSTKVTLTDTSGNPVAKEDTSISNAEYWFIYGILFLIMMVNIFASTQIATSIVTEKSTRVVEYLLISVKSLALMVGKIIAMLTAVIIQIVTILIAVVISSKVTALFSSGQNQSLLSQYLPKNIFQNLNVVNILFCLILIITGMIFYATLAGLAGATVSKLEEINEGLMLFTFTNLIGVYIGLGAASVLMGSGINGYVIFAFLFPLSSPFILPGAILIGKATLLMALGAIALQLVSIFLLFKFVAKIYETLILHTGNTVKLKELILMFKITQGGKQR